MDSDARKKVVDLAAELQLLLEPDAVEALSRAPGFSAVLRRLSENNEFFVSKERANEEIARLHTLAERAPAATDAKKEPGEKRPPARYRILSQYDVTEQSFSEGKVENFLGYFRNKFQTLSEMLKKRHGLSPRPIARLRQANVNSEVDLVGMVYKKWVSKNGHVAIQIEDEETKCIALVLKTDKKTMDLAEHVIADNVIGVKATKTSDDLVIVRDIFFPDLPQRKKRLIDSPVSLVAISDVHVGSRLFMENEFRSFIDWLHGRGIDDPEEIARIRRIKYVVVTGDNVDGIGVYPGQINELAIKDISKQYEAFMDLLRLFPDDVEVFVCPGNHDAVRNADPMPAIPPRFRFGLDQKPNMHFVGSPAWIDIEGLKILLYHGASFHDLIDSVNFLDHDHPELAMQELLKKRDLMPSYGPKNTVVPEKTDFLTIREEPDYVFNGDMHKNGYVEYRGCTIINSGTWQDRTDYQIKLGHHPTPGIAVIVDLDSGRVVEKNFAKDETRLVKVPIT